MGSLPWGRDSWGPGHGVRQARACPGTPQGGRSPAWGTRNPTGGKYLGPNPRQSRGGAVAMRGRGSSFPLPETLGPFFMGPQTPHGNACALPLSVADARQPLRPGAVGSYVPGAPAKTPPPQLTRVKKWLGACPRRATPHHWTHPPFFMGSRNSRYNASARLPAVLRAFLGTAETALTRAPFMGSDNSGNSHTLRAREVGTPAWNPCRMGPDGLGAAGAAGEPGPARARG